MHRSRNIKDVNVCIAVGTTKAVKSRRMRWSEQVSYMGGKGKCILGFGGET
jgi:hypothetical protein